MKILFEDYKPSEILRGHLKMGGANDTGERIDVNSLFIERGGRPWIGVMGEYHFSRDSRRHWRTELAKMKAGGISVAATYMFWIYHEETEGHFVFSGDLDIRAFIQECRAQGLDVLLRIGPWVHGECRNGGFPDWLLRKGFRLRESNPGYMRCVRIWYEKVFEQVKGLFYKDGGPIIGVQFENELVDNAQHLLDLKRLALDIGYDAPLYTVTGWNSRYGARIPVDDVLPVFAAYAEAPWANGLDPQPLSPHYAFDPNRNDAAVGMDLLHDCAQDGWRLPYERYPYAMCELGCGLQSTHHRRINISGMDAYAMSLVKLGCGNNLMGYYMYHGGTHKIGRLSTFQESCATGYPNDLSILDYDFHTCLGQYGQAREQYGLLAMLHLFIGDFGSGLAAMEYVPAREAVPCTDMEKLRCCLRTDGRSGYVFVNHYQRMARLKDVPDAEITALDITFPGMDIKGDTAFFLPIHMDLSREHLRWATAQPLCRMDQTYFFAQIDGIPAQYQFILSDGRTETFHAEAGLNGGFTVGHVRIVTIDWARAQYLRRLDGQIYIGERCNLYALDGAVQAIEDGSFSYHRWTGDRFVRVAVERPFHQAVMTLEPADEPFTPRYEQELHLSGPGSRRWYKLTVSSPEGFVPINGPYDTAQVYADGQLAADHFFSGEPWYIPAELLYGRNCYLVMSELGNDCYLEYLRIPE